MNKIEKLREFILHNELKGMQTFDTKNVCGDLTELIYCKDGIDVYICRGWDYLEIFGLSQEEYDSLGDILDI